MILSTGSPKALLSPLDWDHFPLIKFVSLILIPNKGFILSELDILIIKSSSLRLSITSIVLISILFESNDNFINSSSFVPLQIINAFLAKFWLKAISNSAFEPTSNPELNFLLYLTMFFITWDCWLTFIG